MLRVNSTILLHVGYLRKRSISNNSSENTENFIFRKPILGCIFQHCKKTRLPNKKLQSAICVFVLTTEPITFHQNDLHKPLLKTETKIEASQLHWWSEDLELGVKNAANEEIN